MFYVEFQYKWVSFFKEIFNTFQDKGHILRKKLFNLEKVDVFQTQDFLGICICILKSISEMQPIKQGNKCLLPVGKYMNYIYPCTPLYIKHYVISIMQHYNDQYSVSLEDIVLTGVPCHCIYILEKWFTYVKWYIYLRLSDHYKSIILLRVTFSWEIFNTFGCDFSSQGEHTVKIDQSAPPPGSYLMTTTI